MTPPEVAQIIPLIHVAGGRMQEGSPPNDDGERAAAFKELLAQHRGMLPTSSPAHDATSKTRATEIGLELGCCLYFYAGRACPEFGSVGFGFAAQGDTLPEQGHTGSATPFDTGGLWHGFMHPFCHATEEAKKTFLEAHRADLAEWRKSFAHHLRERFATPKDYWNGTPNYDDPFPHADNTDWRAWTMEVRFHEAHALTLALRWCCSMKLREALVEMLRQESDDLDTEAAMDWLSEPSNYLPSNGVKFYEALDNWAMGVVGIMA